jgi:hypothetical protein
MPRIPEPPEMLGENRRDRTISFALQHVVSRHWRRLICSLGREPVESGRPARYHLYYNMSEPRRGD